MTTAPALLSPRESWLARRRELITASDVGAILGVDEYRGPLAVYAAKLGVESEETLPMWRGRHFEDVIAREYAIQTGRPLDPPSPYEITIHPEIPWLGATLDRTITADEHPGRGPLQIKMALGSASRWRQDPPLAYQVQVQTEMACASSSWGALCALIGPGPLKTHDLERDDDFLQAALPQLEAFRERVKRREPPEADAKPGTSQAIRRLWAGEDGTTVDLSAEDMALVKAWQSAIQEKGKARRRIDELENQLRRRLGSASFGALVDGSYLTLKVTKRNGYTVEPTEFRTLKRWWPNRRNR